MINKVMSIVVMLILAMVGFTVLFAIAPSLLGTTLSSIDNGYLLNATGCYVDMPTPTVDVLTSDVYCTMGALYPTLYIFAFVVVVILLFVGMFKTGKIKF